MVLRPQPADVRRGAAYRERHRALAQISDAAIRFYPRGGGHDRWKPSQPYHVALEDSYVRAHWDEINALCKINSIPFNATGEKIRDGGLCCVYEFTWQMDAIMFWDRFKGRWLRGSEFHYPGVRKICRQ